MQKLYSVLLVTFLSFSITIAQQIQSPSEFLGYDIGTKFSRHHQVVDYFKYVASQIPSKVKLEKYGETYERRPLYVTYISSEENIKNLETIRQDNLKNIGILPGNSNPNTAIVWLSYNVHGNEASSTEASMLTLYKLLTKKQDWLKNTIVIIDPCINPDGRDRYVNWYNETSSTPYDIDQQASEHSEPWPGGRPNHYLFDLNRDWAWASQIESQQRLKVYNKWMPHVHVDFHEQGINEPYYFAPAAEPYHEVITNWQRELQDQLGKNHAKYFDREGWLYFTKERFDLFYPSYGDTYPMFMGAIGMTYEQAGHGRAGLGILNDEGEVLTLVDRLTHHTTSGLSTVEVASKNALKINQEFKTYFNTSGLKYKSYVLQGNKDKIDALKSLLDKHEINYGNATGGRVSGFSYTTNSSGSMNTTNNDLVVSTNQPKGKMVKVLFEPNGKLSDSLTYDITAWSLPYAYGLKTIASTKLVSSKKDALEVDFLNKKESNAIGYLLQWNSLKDGQFLADLLKQNVKVRFTEKPFTTSGRNYDRGSLIILRRDNKKLESFDAIVTTSANTHKRELYPATTGYSEKGPDFGSPDIKLVNKVNVAMLSGNGTSSLSYGALWHFFEQQLNYPVTNINTKDFNRINLDKYHILIMPSGWYESILNDSAMNKLKDWIKAGGKVIAIDRALNSFAEKDGFNLKLKSNSDENPASKNLIPYSQRERQYAKQLITGAIFKTKVDTTHPMAFGYSDSYFSLKIGSSTYSLLNNGFNVAHIENSPEKVSGFAGSDVIKTLNNTLVFGEERLGNGSLIYFADNVMFRSFWENGKLFFVNSLFFVNNNTFEL